MGESLELSLLALSRRRLKKSFRNQLTVPALSGRRDLQREMVPSPKPKEFNMFASLFFASFIALADAPAPADLDILVEEPVGVCTPSGCPLGGRIEVEKPSEEGSKN